MEQLLIVSSALLWVMVLLNLLLVLALIRRLNDGVQPKVGIPPGQVAPHFTAETVYGENVSLAAYTNRAVAFIFISASCPPCRESLPRFEALRLDAARSNVELVLVSLSNRQETQGLVDEFHITLPVLVAPRESNAFAKDYDATGTPSYCLIDAQGKVVSSGFTNQKFGAWETLVASWESITPVADSSLLAARG